MFSRVFMNNIKSWAGVSFATVLLGLDFYDKSYRAIRRPWPFAFSSILRSLQIGGLWLVAWQFWLFLIPSSPAIISSLVDSIPLAYTRLTPFVLFPIFFFYLLNPRALFIIQLVTHFNISRQENTMRGEQLNDERNRRVTVTFDVLQILNGALETWLSSFRFMTSDFAPSGTSINV